MEDLLKNVTKEMIETEKDFYNQMDLLATRFLPLIKQVGVAITLHTQHNTLSYLKLNEPLVGGHTDDCLGCCTCRQNRDCSKHI